MPEPEAAKAPAQADQAPESSDASSGGSDPRAALKGLPLTEQQAALAPPGAGPAGFRPPDPRDPASFDDALARHGDHRGQVKRVIQRSAKLSAKGDAPLDERTTRLRNSAQWLQKGEAKVYVLSATHDSHLRMELARKERAYFDTRRTLEDGSGTYAPRAGDEKVPKVDDAIVVARYGSEGGMQEGGDRLVFYEPKSDAEIEEVLIHEVQHDADQHFEGGAWEAKDVGVAGNPTIERADHSSVNSYRSEFAAFWLAEEIEASPDAPATNFMVTSVRPGGDGKWGTPDDASRGARTSFQNARQEAVFVQLLGGEGRKGKTNWLNDDETDFTWAYGYVPHFYAWDPAFRAMVDGLTHPESGNFVNSVRIQALSRAMKAGDPSSVLRAAAELDDADRAALADRKTARPFWKQAKHDLPGDLADELGAIVDGTAQAAELFAARYPDAMPIGARIPLFEDPEEEAAVAPGAAEGKSSKPRRKGKAGEAPRIELFADRYAVVQRGDSLQKIAARELGDAKRWPEIAALNASHVKAPKYILRKGQQLALPDK